MKTACVLLLSCLAALPLLAQSDYQAGDHELLFMPTATTMPKGQWYFTDYELFVLNFATAVTSRTHVGVLFLFPVTADFLETISLGLKQNYLQSETITGALWATYTPDAGALTLGNVLSVPFGATSLHLGLGAATGRDAENWEFIFLGGLRHDLSRRTSFLLEYANTNSAIEEDFNGLISIGLRFRSSKMAWEIAGLRPLMDTKDILFLPLLKATILL